MLPLYNHTAYHTYNIIMPLLLHVHIYIYVTIHIILVIIKLTNEDSGSRYLK